MDKINDVKIYQRYLEIKANKGRVGDIFKEFSISRTSLYDAIRRVQSGNGAGLKRCLSMSRFECFWEYKYKERVHLLPNDRTAKTVRELREIIAEMKKDGFPMSLIAEKLKKDRSTIIHHIANTVGNY